ncbi:MAG TPA: hypothetical protein PLU11_01740 [Chitinophagaceae bacterium]|nr:hypothetical protein [Chitinophagaceae bacterium]HPH31852.1 hypothetical protein [Chitinophagaceae bacterium]HPN57855.1 hypothetical protein [Chitinophagaceae bacterium]
MNRVFVLLLSILFFSSCDSVTQKSGGKAVNPDGTPMQEGKDYMILKRFRVVDNQGFSQPVEVSSFLLPANWTVKSEVNWNATSKCLPEMLQASVQASSPDAAYELLVYPATQFDWSDDPIYLDAMQKGFVMHSCTAAQPQDAAGYISGTLAPFMRANVKSASIIESLQQQMDAGAMQMTQAARQGGNTAYNHKGSAAEGVLQFEDGKEGLAFCTLMQTLVSVPGAQGGMSTNTQCYVSMRVVIKYKPGNEPMARKIMSTFFSSARINPQWASGVQSYFAAVTRNAQDEGWKQIQISHQAQQEIGDNIIRSWESKNASEGSRASDTESFGQYLRGVDNWTDEGGNKVELTSGYSNAWSRGDGSYMLSNNPAFDPNTIAGETQSWSRLKQ